MPILCDLRINGQTVATVEIRNDGTGTEEHGNYNVFLAEGQTRSLSLMHRRRTDQVGRVEGFDRTLGAVELLRQALNALPKG